MCSVFNEVGLRDLVNVWLETSLEKEEIVSCRQLLKKSLPQYIKNSFLIYAKKNVKLESPIAWHFQNTYDPDDQEVRKAREKLISALQLSVRFSKNDVKACIRNALKIRFELVLRPPVAIKSFFFKKSDHTDKRLILRSIDNYGEGILFLEYLSEILFNYNKNSIRSTTLDTLSDQASEKAYNTTQQKPILKEFDLLVDFFNINGTIHKRDMDKDLVKEFLSSRGRRDLYRIIQKEERTYWSKKDIHNILNPVEIEKKKQQPFFPKVIYDDENYFIIHRQKIERQPPGPYPSIFNFIKRKDWNKFVRKLFRKDEEAFIGFIHKLDNIGKWRDAKQIIDWEFEKRHLDPYGREAVRLSDVVFAKFFSKGVYN